jgi:hypothetical protein
MTNQQIISILEMLQECGKEASAGNVYEIVRIIGETVSAEQIEQAIALKDSQDNTGWVF